MPLSDHKLKIGQLVDYLSRERASAAMPAENEVSQYRIKNANEPHEGVVKENELSSRG
jgi:hypothetical protein